MAHIRRFTRIASLCLVGLHLTAASSRAVVIGKVYWSSNSTLSISRCNLDGTQVETVVKPWVYLTGPALALGQQNMYWAEQSSLVIRRANLDGTGTQTIVTGLYPNAQGIAVDEPHNRLFWTDDSGRVYRANLNGAFKTELRATANRALNIAYDPVGDKIYWAESFGLQGGTPHIWRSNPDGTGAQDLILSGLDNPYSLALDVNARKMYWGDRDLDTIFRANLDGTGIETIASGVSDPTAIAVDSTSGLLYYANGSAIMRANLDGTQPAVFVPDQMAVFGLGVIPLPEPATLLLLALGGLEVMRRRRR